MHLLDGRLIVSSDAAPVVDAVMRLAHDDAGHPGATGTTNRILASGVTIPAIHRVAREHVGSCVSCQIAKAGAKRDAYAPIGVVASATHFMKTVTVDLKGPLPVSRGCRYIFVVVCRATRSTILESMIDATSRSFAEPLGDVFMRFGIPDLVRSDSGPCMVGPEARMLEEQLGYVHDRSVNRPARNGDVERRMPMVATDGDVERRFLLTVVTRRLLACRAAPLNWPRSCEAAAGNCNTSWWSKYGGGCFEIEQSC